MQEDRANILRARDTGKAVLTSPFKLLGSHHLGVVLTFPVYKSLLSPNPTVEERIQATAGYGLPSCLYRFISTSPSFYLQHFMAFLKFLEQW